MLMKNFLKLPVLLGFLVLVFALTGCDTSGGGNPDETETEGMIITINGVPDGVIPLQDTDGTEGAIGMIFISNGMQNGEDAAAFGFGAFLKNPGNSEILGVFQLFDEMFSENAKPWNKSGDYILLLVAPILGDETNPSGYVYTNGKTLFDLGIDDLDDPSGASKLPKYSFMKNVDPMINFNLFIDIGPVNKGDK